MSEDLGQKRRDEDWKIHWDGPYSEAKRLFIEGQWARTEFAKKIDRELSVPPTMRRPSKPAGWKREKMTRGHYRVRAFEILNQIMGVERAGTRAMKMGPGRLDFRLEWLLVEIRRHAPKTRPRIFLEAIAIDANVWPEPKWLQMMRRMKVEWPPKPKVFASQK